MHSLIRRLAPLLLMLSLILASHVSVASAFHQKPDAASLAHCALSGYQGDEKGPVEKRHDGCFTCQTCAQLHSLQPIFISFDRFVATPRAGYRAASVASIHVWRQSSDGRLARAPPIIS